MKRRLPNRLAVLAPTRAGWAAWWAALAVALAVGLELRYDDVTEQVLGGDEYHSVRVARDHTLVEAFTHYEAAENSIPFTLWARLLMDTVGLTEWRHRLPAILAGALLLLAPLAFAARVGRRAALLAVALTATGTMAVYYSFVARPYGPGALLLAASVLAWRRWVTGSGRGAAPAWIAAAAAAVFVHLLCLFPVGWLTVLAWRASRRGEMAPGAFRRGTLGLLALGLALFLPGLGGLLEHRLLGSTRPAAGDPALAWEAFAGLVGHGHAVAAGLAALMVVGAVALVRRDRLLGPALAGLVPALLVGMLVTQAFPTASAWKRYLFLGEWSLHLLVGAGAVAVLDAALGAVGRRARLPALPALPALGAAALLAVAVVAARATLTPVPLFHAPVDSLRARRSATQVLHPDDVSRLRALAHPALQATALEPDGGDVVLLWPYRVMTELWKPFVGHQLVLGRRVVMVHERGLQPLREAGVHLRNTVDWTRITEMSGRGARYLVLDLDFVEAAPGAPPKPVPADAIAPAMRAGAFVSRPYYETLRATLRRRHGEPGFEDDRLVIYDLWADRP